MLRLSRTAAARTLAALLLIAPVAGAGDPTPVEIVIYAAFGNPEAIWVTGRALESEERTEPSEDDSAWKNLRRTIDDLETDEVPRLPLRVECGETKSLHGLPSACSLVAP